MTCDEIFQINGFTYSGLEYAVKLNSEPILDFYISCNCQPQKLEVGKFFVERMLCLGHRKIKNVKIVLFLESVIFCDYSLSVKLYNYLFDYRIRKEMEVNILDEGLAHSVNRGDIQLINWFIEMGADINILTWTKDPLVVLAAAKGNLETIKFLVEKGGDIWARNSDSRENALECAIENHHLGVFDYINSLSV